MKKLRHRLFSTELLCIWIFWLLLASVTIALQYFAAAIELRITAKANRIEIAQVYWRNNSSHYKERNSAKRRVDEDYNELKFSLNYAGSIDYIRLDPLKDKGTLEITSAKLYFPFREPIDILPDLLSDHLVPLQQGTAIVEGNKLFLKSSGQDPAFEFSHSVNALSIISISTVLLSCISCAVATSFLLNQDLLKGDKMSGMLSITLPKNNKLSPPTLLSSTRGYINSTSHENRWKYTFPIKHLTNEKLIELLADIRSNNPEAITVFHYNRTGEI